MTDFRLVPVEPTPRHVADGWKINPQYLSHIQRMSAEAGWKIDYQEQVEAVILAHQAAAPPQPEGEAVVPSWLREYDAAWLRGSEAEARADAATQRAAHAEDIVAKTRAANFELEKRAEAAEAQLAYHDERARKAENRAAYADLCVEKAEAQLAELTVAHAELKARLLVDIRAAVATAEAQLVEEQAETARWLDKAARLQAQVATAEEQIAEERAVRDELNKRLDIWLCRAAEGEARIAVLEEALRGMLADVQDYPAWERPCHAVDVARAALAAASDGDPTG